jgi:hypothetical protein
VNAALVRPTAIAIFDEIQSLARRRFEIEGVDHPASIANDHIAHAIGAAPALTDEDTPRNDLT